MATRIKEGLIPYTGGIGIEITDNHVINVLLREMNNLIEVNGDNELYVDLQLPSGITPTDDFPVGVTTGKILQADGWQQSGLILNWKTTSGDYFRLIYANDGKLYYDPGTGVWHEFGSGGGSCGCHDVLNMEFIEDIHYDEDLDERVGDKSLIHSKTVMATPSKGTIISGYWDNFSGETCATKITFDGTTTVDIVYPHGIDTRPDGLDSQGYPGGEFTGIISEGKFFVWNVELHGGA